LILSELAQKLIQIQTLEASCTRLLGLTTLPSSILTQAFASEVIPFNKDSSFWVCDNLTTGHICNNKSLFSREMVPLIYIVGAAVGTTETTLMGMIVLCTTDNNGKKHVFTMTHMNYIPNLPVNLLSTRVLSKQYVDENEFDKQGTGVWSAYDTHVLIWDHSQYSKTFKTHSFGLPECLFNSGYFLNSFTTFLMQHHDNSINWAFSSAVKTKSWWLQMMVPELQLYREMVIRLSKSLRHLRTQ
jgi:hypothetical protein